MSRRGAAAALGLLILAAALVHGPALQGGFILDDRDLARSRLADGRPNPFVTGAVPFLDTWRRHYWASVEPADPQYRPVTILSFALVYRLAGRGARTDLGEARPQRAVNLLLHLAAILVVYRLLRRLHLPRGGALAGAAVFAAHAVHTEVLGAVVGRAELLAFVGGGAGILALRARDRRWVPAGALAFFLAAGAKEHGYLFPAVALLLGTPWRRALLAALPLALLLALWGWVLLHLPPLPPVSPLTNPLAALGFPGRLPPALWAWLHGLGQTLWPHRLSCDYSATVFPVDLDFADPRALAGAAGWLLLLVAGTSRHLPRPLRLAALFYLLFTLPTANFLLPIGTIFGERLLYTPTFALALAAAGAAARAPRVVLPLVGLWVGWNGVHTHVRLEDWRDEARLVLHDVQVQPRSARLHYLAAKVHERAGREAAMAAELQRAVGLYPPYALAWNDLGVLAARRGRWAEAERAFARGLAGRDAAPRVRALLAVNRASLLALRGEGRRAVRFLLLAVAADPGAAAGALAPRRRRFEALLGRGALLRVFRAGAARAPEDPRWRAWAGGKR